MIHCECWRLVHWFSKRKWCVKDITELVKDITELVKDITELVKDITELVKDITELVKDITQLVKDITQLVKIITHFVTNKTKTTDAGNSVQFCKIWEAVVDMFCCIYTLCLWRRKEGNISSMINWN